MRLLRVEQAAFNEDFNVHPLAIGHDLHTHPVFAADSVQQLVRGWPDKDFFVAAGASGAATPFYSTSSVALTPAGAFDQLNNGSYRILLKRLERHSTPFRDLLATLVAEIIGIRPQLRGQRIIRLESFLFISSASTITPFHFDPEIGFFFQVLGDKVYHLYSPSVLAEDELERYYLRGAIDIGQVDFERRRQHPEYRFDLRPGWGMHQPANAPHWVETRDTLSISYSFAIETDQTRAMGRTRAFNGLCRHLAMKPARPGQRPVADSIKANCMKVVRPLLTGAQVLRKRIT